MTVSSTTRKAGPFTGDGVVDTFPFTFKVFTAADVLVVSADADGVETTLTLVADYTVSLNADQDTSPGGDVVLDAALTSGHTLIVSSAADETQLTEITSSGSFSPRVINKALDKLAILIQQVSERVGRAVKVPITSSDDPDELVATVVQSAASAAAAATAASASASGALHGLDVRWYGGVSGGSSAANATAFSATVTAAIAGGVKRVYVPFDSWTVTTGTDAQGCIVAGNGVTALTGVIGASRYDGCVISGVNQDYMAIHPVIPYDTAMKLVKIHDANTMRIMVQKPTTGYAYLTLKNNSTTAGNDSLAVTTTDATMWRVASIQDAVECVVGVLTASGGAGVGYNGTWSDVTLTTDIPTHTSGTSYTYKQCIQPTITVEADKSWYKFSVTVPLDGELSVGFIESSGSSGNVTILVDGVAVESGFSLVSSTTRRRIRKYTVSPGVRVVQITNHDVAGKIINLLGLYFNQLKNARNDIAYDAYGTYRNSAKIDPVIQSSANDLVLKDYNSAVSGTPGIYGGSYHGGESGISSMLYVNGVAATISSGNLFVGSSVELQQDCTITWSGAKATCTYSGASVTVHTRTIAIIGGHAQCATVTGSFTARELYPTLVGVNEDYTAITSPQYKQLDTISNNATFPLGQNNSVEYHYAATGQRLRITHSLLSCPDSANGGSYIWRVVGSYCKYYSPWVWRGKRSVSSITSVNIVQAS